MITLLAYHALTLEKPALTADLLTRFAEDVLAGRWQGNKAVLIASEETGGVLARPCRTCQHPANALLPMEANGNDPFVMALRRIEFENGRLLQAQILFLKGPELVPFRDAVSAALERRHTEIGKLWAQALEGVGITIPRAE